MAIRNDILFTLKMRDQMSPALKKAGISTKQMANNAAIAQKRFKALGATMTNLKTKVLSLQAGMLALGIGFGLGIIVRTLADFEQSMANVKAVTGATGMEFASLTRLAKELGATTRFTASQAAAGMEFLARAGFTTVQVLKALPDTLNLAAAASMDLGRAADIMSNIMSAFRIPAGEAASVSDLLAKTAATSNTNIEQLGQALKFAGPVASAFGVSLKDTSSALSVLADAGLQATLGGTGLRRIISELSAPTTKLTKILSKLNIPLAAVRPSTVGLSTALETLKNGLFKAEDAMAVFGQRAGPAFNILFQSLPQLKETERRLSDVAGTAKKMSDIMDDNLGGAFRKLKSAFEALIIDSGGLSSTIRGLVESFTSFLRALNGTLDPATKNARAFVILAESIKIATLALIGFAVGRVLIFFGNLAVAVALQIKVWRGLNFVIRSTPWGLIITAAATLGAVIFAFTRETEAAVTQQERLAEVIGKTTEAQKEAARAAEITITKLRLQRQEELLASIKGESKALKEVAEEYEAAEKAGREFDRTGISVEANEAMDRLITGAFGARQAFDFGALSVDRINKKIIELGKLLVDLQKKDIPSIDVGKELEDQIKKNVAILQLETTALFDRAEIIKQNTIVSAQNKAIIEAKLKLDKQAIEDGKEKRDLDEREISIIRAKAAAIFILKDAEKARKAEEKTAKQSAKFITDLKIETELARELMKLRGLDAMEIRIQTAVLKAQAQAKKKNLELDAETIRAIRENALVMEELNNETLTVQQTIKEFWEDYVKQANDANAMTVTIMQTAVSSLETEMTKFFMGQEVNWRNMIQTIISEIVKLAVVKPLIASIFGPLTGATGGGFLGNIFGNLFGGTSSKTGFIPQGSIVPAGQIGVAKGGVFENRKLVKLAKGDVLTGPTDLGVVKTSTGLTRVIGGESGPEGVLPLQRIGGELGVNAANVGGTFHYAPVFNISTSEGFNRGDSEGGDNKTLAKVLDNEVRRVVIEVLQREHRPGGIISPVRQAVEFN